jgi:hypothetical protein
MQYSIIHALFLNLQVCIDILKSGGHEVDVKTNLSPGLISLVSLIETLFDSHFFFFFVIYHFDLEELKSIIHKYNGLIIRRLEYLGFVSCRVSKARLH